MVGLDLRIFLLLSYARQDITICLKGHHRPNVGLRGCYWRLEVWLNTPCKSNWFFIAFSVEATFIRIIDSPISWFKQHRYLNRTDEHQSIPKLYHNLYTRLCLFIYVFYKPSDETSAYITEKTFSSRAFLWSQYTIPDRLLTTSSSIGLSNGTI